jgi:hypothetical protein
MEWKIHYVVSVISSLLQAIHLMTLQEEVCCAQWLGFFFLIYTSLAAYSAQGTNTTLVTTVTALKCQQSKTGKKMLDVAVHQSQVKCMLINSDIIREWCITVSKLKLNHITDVVVWTVLEHICNIVRENFTVNWTSNDEWACQLMNIFVGLTSTVLTFYSKKRW